MPGIASCPGGFGGASCPSGFGWASCPTYRRARICPSPNGTLANVWMTSTDAAKLTGAFALPDGSCTNCYYFQFTDVTFTAPGGTLYTAAQANAYSDCTSCDPSGCTDRLSCATYLISFNSTITKFTDPFGTVANCAVIGTNAVTCPAQSNVYTDVVLTTSGCEANAGGLSPVLCGDLGNVAIEALCGFDDITFSAGSPLSNVDARRTREADVTGAYPDFTTCAYDGSGKSILYQITGIVVTSGCMGSASPPRRLAKAGKHFDWSVVGPVMWAELHLRGKAFAGDVAAELEWYVGWKARISCGSCKNDWLKWEAANPIRLESSEAYHAWGCDGHNAVNVNLKKPVWNPPPENNRGD